jgi:serine/threonine-protein kinase RsbW
MEWETKVFPAALEHLAEANDFIESFADRFGFDTKKKFGVLLALEEAFVNICSYAYPDGAGNAEICCGRDNNSLILEIADAGRPFDILSLPDPDITLGIEERSAGGLGIHFIRTLSDSVSYRRENDRNVLRMTFSG